MVLWRPTKNINFSIPEELLIEVDEAAKAHYMSRTEYIRHVLHKEVSGRYPQVVTRVVRENPSRFLDLDDS
jgi:metal-responsive CopG/Arc/MetJ family transcriptional regulator